MSLERAKKIDELIKREMSKIFLKEIEPPEGSLVTITQVETSQDLLESKIWVSVFPIFFAKQILKEINKKIGHLQGLLNRRLIIYPLPRIRFVLDQTEERASKIEKIFDKIRK
ncbi:MAG: 30S ribosome-binding factor RbfA [Patescibacteria group bacterium]|jgi:ribosome-binding factor A|nr:30S ribosome-binding factor RbfA [Patescibacteria group bacterium]